MLFDSDNCDGKTLFDTVLNHKHLYFIVFDSENNVFGQYYDSKLTEKVNKDIISNKHLIPIDRLFLFTLNSNGRCGIKKFDRKKGNIYEYNLLFSQCQKNNYGLPLIKEDKYWYKCNCEDEGSFNSFRICEINVDDSYIDDGFINTFEGIETTALTGKSYNSVTNEGSFTPKRLVVIEMKESEEMKQQMKIQTKQTYESYVVRNIPKLEEWSGMKYDNVIFDSDVNEVKHSRRE